MQQILVCDSWNHSVQAKNDFIVKWNPDEVLKTALWKTGGQNPLAMENLPVLQAGLVATPPENCAFLPVFLVGC